jgi:hypothetical protein
VPAAARTLPQRSGHECGVVESSVLASPLCESPSAVADHEWTAVGIEGLRATNTPPLLRVGRAMRTSGRLPGRPRMGRRSNNPCASRCTVGVHMCARRFGIAICRQQCEGSRGYCLCRRGSRRNNAKGSWHSGRTTHDFISRVCSERRWRRRPRRRRWRPRLRWWSHSFPRSRAGQGRGRTWSRDGARTRHEGSPEPAARAPRRPLGRT